MINEISCIDKYWRAANYLTVLQMYMRENCLLKEPLLKEHMKRVSTGHWGTSPGLNFVYAHLNALTKRYELDMMLIVGPGHAACGLLSNLYLEGTLEEYYPELVQNEEGMIKFVNSFGNVSGFRSEIYPGLPGCIYDGGELGYSLSVAYGAALDNKNTIIACLIGDGEAETGPLATAWHGIKFLNHEESGTVLPILHLNGYKMGSPSIFSTMTDEELISYFKGLGYNPKIVSGNHQDMYQTLEWAYGVIKSNKLSDTEDKTDCLSWPMIVLKTPKGWTGIIKEGVVTIEGSSSSHKTPALSKDPATAVNILEEWLKSYRPEELFDCNGIPVGDIKGIIPQGCFKLGKNRNTIGGNVKKDLQIPDISKYGMDIPVPGEVNYKNINILSEYLKDILKLNDVNKNFRIFSPDELVSNGLGGVFDETSLCYSRDIETCDVSISKEGRVMEMLSEHTCQGWLQGYIMTGRHGIFPTYEAFAPIVGSMLTQYCKFMYQSLKLSWRKPVSSFNYILTSLCWSNTYSHQNPEFVNILTSKNMPFVRAYFPCDANTLLACMNICLNSENRVNVIVTSKRDLPQWVDIKNADNHAEKGISIWKWVEGPESCMPDIVFAAAGDHTTRECMECIKELKELIPDVRIRFVSVIELTAIGSEETYPHAINNREFENIFPRGVPVVFNFHGYPSAIKNLLFDRPGSQQFKIFGYKDASDTSSPELDKMIRNGVSRYQLAIAAGELLHSQNKICRNDYDSIKNSFTEKINEYKSHVLRP